nr:hypothetical protein [Pseudomonas sp.]
HPFIGTLAAFDQLLLEALVVDMINRKAVIDIAHAQAQIAEPGGLKISNHVQIGRPKALPGYHVRANGPGLCRLRRWCRGGQHERRREHESKHTGGGEKPRAKDGFHPGASEKDAAARNLAACHLHRLAGEKLLGCRNGFLHPAERRFRYWLLRSFAAVMQADCWLKLTLERLDWLQTVLARSD